MNLLYYRYNHQPDHHDEPYHFNHGRHLQSSPRRQRSGWLQRTNQFSPRNRNIRYLEKTWKVLTKTSCLQRVETKEFAKNWLGKVRELKSMIHEFKGNQIKVIKSNNIIIADNLKLKEQMNRIESVLTGLKVKLVDSTEESSNQINCPNGHKIMFSSFYENFTVCTKCKKNCEVGYNCNLCSYSICRSCYKISFKEKFGKHDITYFRNHKLTWTTNHSLYQNYDKKVFNCSGCKKRCLRIVIIVKFEMGYLL